MSPAAPESSGTIPTRDRRQLTLVIGAGNVRIFADAAKEVHFRVRVTPADDPRASTLLQEAALAARATERGVALTPQPALRQNPMQKALQNALQNALQHPMRSVPDMRAFAAAAPSDTQWQGLSVEYEVHVPRRYSLQVSAGSGNITVDDINGDITLVTGAGDIQARRIGFMGDSPDKSGTPARAAEHGAFVARLGTAGGHIFVGDVAGGLRALTGGGHITVNSVYGDADLHSGGGHIRAGHVTGQAQLSTGGGNIMADCLDGGATADSDGGLIEFGEAAGAIRARTGGGGIRIGKLAGPANLDSADGGILLLDVQARVRAVTASGGITAAFSPQFNREASAHPAGESAKPAPGEPPSELLSGDGDVAVYLPQHTPITIRTVLGQSAGHRIVADPAIPIKATYQDFAGGRALRGLSLLNGGGGVMLLKAAAGDIELRFLDDATAARLAQQQAELAVRRSAARMAMLAEMNRQTSQTSAGRTAQATAETNLHSNYAGHAQQRRAADVTAAPEMHGDAAQGRGSAAGAALSGAPPAPWWRDLLASGVNVSPDEQQKRLLASVAPAYPDAARAAGIEGDVTLRVTIGADGNVKDIDPLSGHSALVRAAMQAVAQWRYAPALLDGWPVSVVTNVTIAFRLR